MKLKEALQKVREGKSVRRPGPPFHLVHIFPERVFTLTIEDRIADDWEVLDRDPSKESK